jgi:undecaprenyl-diphosphatase
MDSIIIFCAKYLFIAVVLIYAWAIYQASPRHRKALAISLIAAGIAAVILDKAAGKLYYDPRPFVSHNVKPLIAHSADNGFPSEHSLFSMTLAAALYFYRRKLGMAAALLAIIVGIARVAAHVHSPIDIIGGVVLGAAAGYIGFRTAERYSDRPVKRRAGQ